jgi:ADP-ribose pyrophosphatase YjhB (NUDIX family)
MEKKIYKGNPIQNSIPIIRLGINPVVFNIFCATGEGGGIDPTCKKEDSEIVSTEAGRKALKDLQEKWKGKVDMLVGGWDFRPLKETLQKFNVGKKLQEAAQILSDTFFPKPKVDVVKERDKDLANLRRDIYKKTISTVKEELKTLKVTPEEIWEKDLKTLPQLRSLGVNNPEGFTKKMTYLEHSFRSALNLVKDSPGSPAPILMSKLRELQELRKEVADYHMSYDVQVIPETFGKRGAGEVNKRIAYDFFSSGGDHKGAVKELMKKSGLAESTAKSYVRNALKQYKADQETKLKETRQQIRIEAKAELGDKYWGSKYQSYWRPGVNPTVDLRVERENKGRKEILLIQRADKDSHGNPVAEGGKWALPGGFIDTPAPKGLPFKYGKEKPKDAALRELKEETGLSLKELKKLMKPVGIYNKFGRDPRDNEEAYSESHAFAITLPKSHFEKSEKVFGTDDAKNAKWVPVSQLKNYKLAFDHAQIIRDAKRVRVLNFHDLPCVG